MMDCSPLTLFVVSEFVQWEEEQRMKAERYA
jgi:hypothetical protein